MVDLNKYRKATSYVRSVQLLGSSVGFVLGQLLFSFKLLSYNDALVLTLILIAIALLASFLLPMPQQSMFFHRKRKPAGDFQGEPATEQAGRSGARGHEGVKAESKELAEAQTCGKVLLQMIGDFRDCFASKQLLYWSVWWVMASCGFNQTVNFIQVSDDTHAKGIRPPRYEYEFKAAASRARRWYLLYNIPNYPNLWFLCPCRCSGNMCNLLRMAAFTTEGWRQCPVY